MEQQIDASLITPFFSKNNKLKIIYMNIKSARHLVSPVIFLVMIIALTRLKGVQDVPELTELVCDSLLRVSHTSLSPVHPCGIPLVDCSSENH